MKCDSCGQRLLLALALVLVAGTSWAQPSGGYTPSKAANNYIGMFTPATEGASATSPGYYFGTSGPLVTQTPEKGCAGGGWGCPAFLINGKFPMSSLQNWGSFPALKGFHVQTALIGAMGALSPSMTAFSTALECGTTKDSTGDCSARAFSGILSQASGTTNSSLQVVTSTTYNSDTTPGSQSIMAGVVAYTQGVTGRTHKYEVSIDAHGISGGNPSYDPWTSFRFLSVFNTGRNLFFIGGDTSCNVNTSMGSCMEKQNVPGYALGQYFSLEARGGRGVLFSGGTGQWQVLDGGTRPTCDVDHRGAYWHEFSGAGVKDTVEVCAKDAADAYAWRTLY